MKIATLCYLLDEKNKKILLGKKKYGGAKGKLNGFGGKVESTDKTLLAAIQREFLEETSIHIINPTLSAVLLIEQLPTHEKVCMYIYTCTQWEGEPKESEEMKVKWYNINRVPVNKMWPADSLWFPIVMQNKNILLQLTFLEGQEKPQSILIEFNKTLYENIHEEYK